ncbi:hypothetical protein M2347_000322 [Chryseobacterium sp. H1D6B]|uniref:DUF7674 family protein n=1 Tax=Chryseobacterium sp. H1D6B TaxID=2940588 RepID=UPI0015C9657C|nr:hypothetical protein [Chryseobacterium sp. H1D6B]MDH6250595.1 hypothetical protein [Chryseobacterium sp. H1D6B]
MMNVEMQTINQKIAERYLKIYYPSIRNEISQLSAQNNFPGIIQATINHLKSLLQESKTTIVARNIKVMEWLYRNGNSYLKQIIENLFISSFESLKRNSDPEQWSTLYQYMPLKFQEIHLAQIKQYEVITNKKHF